MNTVQLLAILALGLMGMVLATMGLCDWKERCRCSDWALERQDRAMKEFAELVDRFQKAKNDQTP